MASFNQSSGFCCNPSSEPMSEFSGMLVIFVHHARNIHNICIYDNQDVYAKFSLTYSPDETLSTRIVIGGGKNPEFNENLQMKITQLDAVLKCEIWMLSRARNFLEDQLLGFALVPLSSVIGKGETTQDFTLSSTELFHSPAGTVKLTLLFNASVLPIDPSAKPFSHSSNLTRSPSSIASEVVLLDPKPEVIDPVEYGSVEFPDFDVARENQQMVSEYFDMADRFRPNYTTAPFLYLGASSSLQPNDDYDMTVNSSEENSGGSSSPNDSSVLDHENSYQNSGVFTFSSTATSLSDDRNSVEFVVEKKSESSNLQLVSISEDYQSHGDSPGTPTSKNESAVSGDNSKESTHHHSSKEEEKSGKSTGSVELNPIFTAPLVNINLEPEQTAMQQQIVDMYMRSMQQFTESLAKMKLPMDLDKPRSDDGGDVIQSKNMNLDKENNKKDGSRVFYGSHAFF